jgi:hypothetical protein
MMIDILREQIAGMRLTDEEREAVEWASTVDWGSNPHAATLRGLLERLGGAA